MYHTTGPILNIRHRISAWKDAVYLKQYTELPLHKCNECARNTTGPKVKEIESGIYYLPESTSVEIEGEGS